jgi:hypothetical protein
MAVIVVPALLFALFSGGPAASQQSRSTESRSRAVRIDMKLTSYSAVSKAAQLKAAQLKAAQSAALYQAVAAQQEAAYLKAVAAANANVMPAAWEATAKCEEGGRNDHYAGYFGILEWHGFDGYPTAGSAPLSVQLAWEAAHGQGPPDAPGQCHSY